MAVDTTLKAVITADTSQAKSQLDGFASSLKSQREGLLAIGAASGVAFAGIAAFAKSSIDAANEHAKAEAQLGAVLKSTGGVAGVTAQQANELSEAIQRTTTYSNDAALSAENMLLTFTAIGKDTFPQATQTTLDMATALGEDTKDAAIQLGKALQDPVLGVTALRRVGVNFSKDQQDVIKQMVDTGHQAEAQQYILKELNREFGGSAAAAADTYAGKQEQLKNQMDDVQKEIGNALIPVLSQLLNAIVPIITKVGEWIQAHPQLTKWIIILGGLVTGLVTVLTGVALILPPIIAGFTVLLGPVGLVILAITAVIAITTLLVANWGKISEFFKGVWADIQKIFKSAIDAVVAYFQPLIDIVNTVTHALEKAASAAASVASAVGHTISSAVSSVVGHKAAGGSVTGGSSYLVGESGPELFVPGMTGSIIPNYALAGAGGGITVNINGGTYLSSDAARLLGNKIIEQLQLKARL